MSTLFDKMSTWLPAKVEQAAAVSLTLSRGSQVTTGVTAVVGQVAFRMDADGGQRVQVGDRDYLVRAEEYLIGGEAVTPRIGDRYQEDGASDVWELQDPENGEPAWRYSDGETRLVYRLHVKRVTR